MFECIKYSRTSDSNKFKCYDAEEALTHELKINDKVKDFKLVRYDALDEEHYRETAKDFNNLVALAEDIWRKTDYIYICNADAFNFINNLADLLENDEYKTDVLKDTYETIYEGAGWYEYSGTVFIPLQVQIDNFIENISDIKSKPIANSDTAFLTYCENKLAELKSTITNLNKFIKGES